MQPLRRLLLSKGKVFRLLIKVVSESFNPSLVSPRLPAGIRLCKELVPISQPWHLELHEDQVEVRNEL